MRFTPISQRTKTLQIRVSPQWPSILPPCFFHGVQLSGFDSSTKTGLDLDPATHKLEEILFDLYPKMNLMDFASLMHKASELGFSLSVEKMAVHYGWRATEDFDRTIDLLLALPEEMQIWCAEKDVNVNDLAPFRAVTNFDRLNKYLRLIALKSPSRSDGVQVFEWLVDLSLSETDVSEFLPSHASFSEIKAALYRARYPKAYAQSQTQTQLAKKLPWPKHAQVRATRSGDQSGFEVKLFVRSPEELNSQIRGLEAVATTLDQGSAP